MGFHTCTWLFSLFQHLACRADRVNLYMLLSDSWVKFTEINTMMFLLLFLSCSGCRSLTRVSTRSVCLHTEPGRSSNTNSPLPSPTPRASAWSDAQLDNSFRYGPHVSGGSSIDRCCYGLERSSQTLTPDADSLVCTQLFFLLGNSDLRRVQYMKSICFMFQMPAFQKVYGLNCIYREHISYSESGFCVLQNP